MSAPVTSEVDAPSPQKPIATLIDGDTLSLRKVGRLWAVVSGKRGVVQMADKLRWAEEIVKSAVAADLIRAAWVKSSVDEMIDIEPKIRVALKKKPHQKALRVEVFDTAHPYKGPVAKFSDVEFVNRVNGVIQEEMSARGHLEFKHEEYGEIAISQAERVMGVKATLIGDVRKCPSLIAKFWKHRISVGKSPTEATSKDQQAAIYDLKALMSLQEFVNPEATALLALKLGWPMKTALDSDSGEVVECWLVAPDGSQFDGVEFFDPGTIESDLPEGCTVAEVSTPDTQETGVNGHIVAAVMRLLLDDIEVHSTAANSLSR